VWQKIHFEGGTKSMERHEYWEKVSGVCIKAFNRVGKGYGKVVEKGVLSVNGYVLHYGACCPDCGARLIHESGCVYCRVCGWGRCG